HPRTRSAAELGGKGIVEPKDDDSRDQAAPVTDNPFRPVLSPEDDLVSLDQAGCCQSRGKSPSRASELLVGMSASSIPIVVHEKLAADGDEVAEEVDQRLALHCRIMM